MTNKEGSPKQKIMKYLIFANAVIGAITILDSSFNLLPNEVKEPINTLFFITSSVLFLSLVFLPKKWKDKRTNIVTTGDDSVIETARDPVKGAYSPLIVEDD